MTKYHVSPSTGRPNICRATKRPCPIGGQNEHYSSKDEARAAYETQQSGNTVAVPMKKAQPKSIIEQLPTEPVKRVTFIRDNFDKFPRPAVNASGFPIRPVPSDAELVEEENQFRYGDYGGSYDVDSLIEVRRVNSADVYEAENEWRGFVTVKPPSGSETSISSDLVRKKLGMAKRPRTQSDITANHLSWVELEKAEVRERQASDEAYKTQDFSKHRIVRDQESELRSLHRDIQELERDASHKEDVVLRERLERERTGR